MDLHPKPKPSVLQKEGGETMSSLFTQESPGRVVVVSENASWGVSVTSAFPSPKIPSIHDRYILTYIRIEVRWMGVQVSEGYGIGELVSSRFASIRTPNLTTIEAMIPGWSSRSPNGPPPQTEADRTTKRRWRNDVESLYRGGPRSRII
jgi:hypothetical protein